MSRRPRHSSGVLSTKKATAHRSARASKRGGRTVRRGITLDPRLLGSLPRHSAIRQSTLRIVENPRTSNKSIFVVLLIRRLPFTDLLPVADHRLVDLRVDVLEPHQGEDELLLLWCFGPAIHGLVDSSEGVQGGRDRLPGD